MTTVSFVPPRVPFVDLRTGMITREWYLFLQKLFDPQADLALTDALLLGLSANNGDAQLDTSMQELRQGPVSVTTPAIDDVAPILGLLRDEIAELRKAIEGLGVAP